MVKDDDLTPTGNPRCKGIKKDGVRCGAFAGRSGFCYFHDPNITADAKAKTRVLAGRSSSTVSRVQRLMPPRLRSVFDDVVKAMADVQSGALSPTRASALASLATAAVRVLMTGEMEERQRRIDALLHDPDDSTPPPQYDDE
ncbi:MAG TPA: DUF5763 domain-containing protein [Candidatus Limnocylindrales bacterium]|nr:DUF5763 domain-containing protein [Candidatus Limnocylindrales bacterium]